ncbi:hypothetical protein C8J57DRAFT_1678057 [Mycena rebaudengoi]|nr:hypothetical protein C8J57DRAFT_1678057 [Mycena rebaudengoi]
MSSSMGSPSPVYPWRSERNSFCLVPNEQSAMANSRGFTTHAHMAGSDQDYVDALTMLEFFQTELQIPAPDSSIAQATIDLSSAIKGPRRPTAWVDVYYPVMDTQLEGRLEILGEDGNPTWTADLSEDGDPLDPDAHRHKDTVPAWHGFSGDGDVQGQLIYANYGDPQDYAELVKAGVNLTGKIVIARYGSALRGLKIKGAEDLGAAGMLIYSDPRDDGYITVENGYEPYPAGPARNPTCHRARLPGDPTTPGYPAYENSTRAEATNGPRIPSLPISWGNAERLLEEIDGVGARRTLNGKTSATTVRLVNRVKAEVTPIWNTMAAIPGHVRDEVVVVGCHRDGWVLGAADPISGTVSLQEVVRGFGALLKAGWKPLRTVLFASWDAEEFSLIGSTEYGEDFTEWLKAHAVAYINVDVSAAGSRWGAAGSPSLAHLIRQSALDIPHPTSVGKTLWDAQNDNGPLSLQNGIVDPQFLQAAEAAEARRLAAKNIIVGPLGSGSDFTVFLQRIGIASAAEAFGSTPFDAVYHYHSIYDSQRFQELYADPGFHRATVVAKHLGLMLLRLTDSIILPLNTTQYGLELHDYLDEVEALVPELELTESIDFSTLRSTITNLTSASRELDIEKAKAEKKFKKLLSQMPKFPRAPYRNCWKNADGSLHALPTGSRACLEWEEYLDGQFTMDLHTKPPGAPRLPHLPHIPPIFKFIRAAKRVTKANTKLRQFEQGFLSEKGIKGREWYKHVGVAPGRNLGYGATTFPALHEALALDKDVPSAKEEVERLNILLAKLTEDLRD